MRIAAIQTKGLPRAKFVELREASGVLPFSDFVSDIVVRTQEELDSLFASVRPRPESKAERAMRDCPRRALKLTARAATAIAKADPKKRASSSQG